MYDKPANTLVHSDSAGHIDVENFGSFFSRVSDLLSDVFCEWPISLPRPPALRPVGVRACVSCSAVLSSSAGVVETRAHVLTCALHALAGMNVRERFVPMSMKPGIYRDH